MKATKIKGKKPTKSNRNLIGKSRNQQPQWKKVKLSGNLLSDDGGIGLEGLLGLEVLENAGQSMSITKEKRPKVKRTKVVPDIVEENSEDSMESKRSKNERKKKKKLLKKSKKQNAAVNHEPGRFVRPPPDSDHDDNVIDKTNLGKKKKQKKAKQPKQENDEKSNEAAMTIDDLNVTNVASIRLLIIS